MEMTLFFGGGGLKKIPGIITAIYYFLYSPKTGICHSLEQNSPISPRISARSVLHGDPVTIFVILATKLKRDIFSIR